MHTINRIIKFYINGFKNMTWGRTLWLIILFKLFVFFFIFKLFFFKDKLATQYSTDAERSMHVLENLTNNE